MNKQVLRILEIPYSLITFSPSKPWFDRACSSAISDREGAHRSYQASPSELTHAAFISARNRCSAKLRRARSSFRKRKIDKRKITHPLANARELRMR